MAKEDEESEQTEKNDHKAILIAIKMTKLEFQRIYEEDEGERDEAGEQNLVEVQKADIFATIESLENPDPLSRPVEAVNTSFQQGVLKV